MRSPTKRIFLFGQYFLDPEEHTLLRDGTPISLKPKVFDLLLIFVHDSGRLLTKDELIQRLWPDVAVEDHNLAVTVHELRKALGDTSNSGQSQYIETVPRLGYRFGVEVELTEVNRVSPTTAINKTPPAIDGGATAAENKTQRNLTATEAHRSNSGYMRTILPILIVTGFIVLIVAWQRGFSRYKTSQPFQKIQLTRLTDTGNIKDAYISPDGKYFAYILMNSDKTGLRVRDLGTNNDVEILPQSQGAGRYYGATFSPKDNFIYFLQWEKEDDAAELRSISLAGGDSRKVLTDLSSPISFSPDGEKFAFVRRYRDPKRAALLIANKDGTGERQIAVRNSPDFFSNARPAWSPDGKIIACIAGEPDKGDFFDVVGVRVSDGVEQSISTRVMKRILGIDWLADGSGLIAVALDETAGLVHQLWHLTYPGGKARRITNDLTNYESVTVSKDSGAILTIQSEMFCNIWVKGIAGDDPGVQISTGRFDGRDGVSWTPEGKIIYNSQVGDGYSISLMNSDGSDRRPVTSGPSLRSPSACPDDHTVIFTSQSAEVSHVWKMNLDGTNQQQLTNGSGELWPQCSPDGKFAVYWGRDKSGQLTLWKLSLDGGMPKRLTNLITRTPAVSPEGDRIAFVYLHDGQWRVGIILLESGELVKSIQMPPDIDPYFVIPMRWTPDGKGLLYLDHPSDNVSNIWMLPLDGGESQQLTNFKERRIYSFDVSRSDSRLVFSRAYEVRDVVLIATQ